MSIILGACKNILPQEFKALYRKDFSFLIFISVAVKVLFDYKKSLLMQRYKVLKKI